MLEANTIYVPTSHLKKKADLQAHKHINCSIDRVEL
jgi:hypothetical protein